MPIGTTKTTPPKLDIVYISPTGASYLGMYQCNVEPAADTEGLFRIPFSAQYPAQMFEKHFHGTLTAFYKDGILVTDPKEIRQTFGVSFEYVTALNLTTLKMTASNGVDYSFLNNRFCNRNKSTCAAMIAELRSCNSCYIQLIIEDSSGAILDITLVTNPSEKTMHKFAVDHSLELCFMPLKGSTVVHKKSWFNSSKEKLNQSEIDDLFKFFYSGITHE